MRSVVFATVLFVALLAPAQRAIADGGEEDFTARDFVEQAIGLLRGQPELTELIDDRMVDAVEDDEVDGVDLEQVALAQDAFAAGRLDETRELLERSIGEEDSPILHEPDVGGGLAAPEGTTGPILIVMGALLALAGGLVARKAQ
jgi:hypothetical protein